MLITKDSAVNFLIAPDKFKGSMTARAVSQCIAEVISVRYPSASIEQTPIADGGDGRSVLRSPDGYRPSRGAGRRDGHPARRARLHGVDAAAGPGSDGEGSGSADHPRGRRSVDAPGAGQDRPPRSGAGAAGHDQDRRTLESIRVSRPGTE